MLADCLAIAAFQIAKNDRGKNREYAQHDEGVMNSVNHLRWI